VSAMWRFVKVVVEVLASVAIGLGLLALLPEIGKLIGSGRVDLRPVVQYIGTFIVGCVLLAIVVGVAVTLIEFIVSLPRNERWRLPETAWVGPVVWVWIPVAGALALVVGEIVTASRGTVLQEVACLSAAPFLGAEECGVTVEHVRIVTGLLGLAVVGFLAFGYRIVLKRSEAEREARAKSRNDRRVPPMGYRSNTTNSVPRSD
jgi:hypothetical protein